MLIRFSLLSLSGLFLVACFQQPLPDLSDLPQAPADYPMDRYRTLAAAGASLYTVDSGRSQVRVFVDKTGRMARAGHRHILSSNTVGGLIAQDRDGMWQADLYLPVESFVVDDPRLRAEAGEGYASQIDGDDRAGTRANLLSDKVLDVTQYPFLKVRIGPAELRQAPSLSFQATIRGVTRQIEARHTWEPQSRTVSGHATIVQSDFGMQPFSILGGAVGVGDALELQFELGFQSELLP